MPANPYRALVITGPFSVEQIRKFAALVREIEAAAPDGEFAMLSKRLEGSAKSYEELYALLKAVVPDVAPPGPTLMAREEESRRTRWMTLPPPIWR